MRAFGEIAFWAVVGVGLGAIAYKVIVVPTAAVIWWTF